MSSLYLRDDLEPADAHPGASVDLEGAEARHALTVSRTRVGERIAVGNGRGLIVRGTVTDAGEGRLRVRADQVEQVAHAAPRLTLVQALAKGDRDELAIQAATELGVDAVVPWLAERSVSRWSGAKIARGRERWQTIVREAAKQSIRAWTPVVGDLAGLAELVVLPPRATVLVLDPDARESLTAPDRIEDLRAARELVLVVGPEGGIAPGELSRLEEAGARAVRLGPEVLRTSTAGPAALAAANVLLGRW